MQLRESIDIAADAGAVWRFVADPVLHGRWNPKVVSVQRTSSGPVLPNERFEMVYRMSGQPRHSWVEVETCDPLCRLVFVHRMNGGLREQVARETYEISPSRGGVRVVQTIDLSQITAPWPWRLLLWFICPFSKSESGYLDALKRVVEQPEAKTESSALGSEFPITVNSDQVNSDVQPRVKEPVRFYPKWKACLVLVLLGLIILFFGVKDWMRDRDDQNWPSAPGIVRTAKIAESMDGDKYAEIAYEYQVEGVSYSSSRISYGHFWPFGTAGAERIVSRYPQGTKVTVFYDPQDRKAATLEPGFTDRTWTAIASGVGFLLWGTLPILFFLMRKKDATTNKV